MILTTEALIKAIEASKIDGVIETWIPDSRDGDGGKEILDKQDISFIDAEALLANLRELEEKE